LDGLMLTGLGDEANDLLQNFVDGTSDIQTAALLACCLLKHQDTKDERLMKWIVTYRDLLNHWGLWTLRAKFDVARALLLAPPNSGKSETSIAQKSRTSTSNSSIKDMTGLPTSSPSRSSSSEMRPEEKTIKGKDSKEMKKYTLDPTQILRPQVYARCNYCQQGLSLPQLIQSQQQGKDSKIAGTRGTSFGTSSKKEVQNIRLSGCPSCKRPLPRCCLCLSYLDVAPPFLGKKIDKTQKQAAKGRVTFADDEEIESHSTPTDKRFDSTSMNPFGNWFTWCQRCRHGGHAQHMSDWFQTHTTCPVTDCDCKCGSLDSSGGISL